MSISISVYTVSFRLVHIFYPLVPENEETIFLYHFGDLSNYLSLSDPDTFHKLGSLEMFSFTE